MKNTNYSKIYSEFTGGLPQKTKEIFSRRFGIGNNKERETLESIGQSFGITRERVRQIEERGFSFVKDQNKSVLNKIYGEFADYFKKSGGFKREDIVLENLGGKNYQPYIFFLLTLGDQFSRVFEKGNYYSFWATIPNAQEEVKKNLDFLVKGFQKIGKPMVRENFLSQFSSKAGLNSQALISLIEISKKIRENKEGKLGLSDWPEINPRGVKDKAFLVFQKVKEPLHFSKVASLINEFEYSLPDKKALPQTVHNELIKDSRFVLVGRGIYALREWGFVEGTVKDIIFKILKEHKNPMKRNKIVEKVLTQRLVEKNTITMSLNDKQYFIRNSQGEYLLRDFS